MAEKPFTIELVLSESQDILVKMKKEALIWEDAGGCVPIYCADQGILVTLAIVSIAALLIGLLVKVSSFRSPT